MFSFQNFTRTLVAASFVTALFAVPMNRLLAAGEPLAKVPCEAVGDPRLMDDSARPSADTRMHLTFALNSAQTEQIADFVATLTDPKSPNFHKWLKPKEFGEKFGASSADIDNVTKYLTANQFSNVKVWSNRLFVTGDISRSSAESLFGLTIHGYDRTADQISRGYSATYYAPDHAPTIAPSIATSLQGIYGMSNLLQRLPNIRKAGLTAFYTQGAALDPSDLSTAYNEAALHSAGDFGQGTTIAIFSPTTYTPSDVSTFFADENITSPTINIINVNGGATDALDEGEATLDIETVGGQASEATIDVYEGPNDGSLDIFQQVSEDDTAQILSESYGAEEYDLATNYGSQASAAAFATSYELLRSQMSAEGITIFVASGDNGAYSDVGVSATTPVFNYSVTIDASSAYVTAVGGTELSLTSTSTWASEVAWSFGDNATNFGPNLGSNGGLSIYYKIPAWQVGTTVDKTGISDGFRQVPDVSALAGIPNYNIYDDGAFQPVEGTSGACPLWASSVALIESELGARLGNIDPALYTIGNSSNKVFHDITSGFNGQLDTDNYVCTTGWDFVTGWGSADFGQLATAIASTITLPTVHTFSPGLQMISIPYDYSGSAVTVVGALTGLVTSTGSTATVVAAWDSLLNGYSITPEDPANKPSVGQGYWARFNATSGGTLDVAGTLEAALIIDVPVNPGWNMIGDPYTTAVPISTLGFQSGSGSQSFGAAAQAGNISSTFYGYNGTAYVPYSAGSSIQPWAGYWIYSAVGGDLVFAQ